MASELAPGDIEILLNLISTTIEFKAFDQAEEALSIAVKLAPENPQIHLYYGDVFAIKGKLDQALESYKCAEEKGVDSGEIHYLSGKAMHLLVTS